MKIGVLSDTHLKEPNSEFKKIIETHFEGVDKYKNTVMKVAVFTEVLMTYKLIHTESGEFETIQAIGQGVDNGDKAAGKSMTYAKKNALLNALLISSGLDADDTHSDDLPTQPVAPAKPNIAELVIIVDRVKLRINALPETHHAEWAAKLPLCQTREELIALGTGAKELAEALKGNAPA